MEKKGQVFRISSDKEKNPTRLRGKADDQIEQSISIFGMNQPGLFVYF